MSESTSIVIFGASGDLNHRKLLPALFNLFRKKRIPENFQILGFATRDWDDQKFRSEMEAAAVKFCSYEYSYDEWLDFAEHLYYQSGNFTHPDDFEVLAGRLQELEPGPSDRMFYLATAPRFFLPIVQELGRLGLVDETEAKRRVVVEKPIGTDLASAHTLNEGLSQVLKEPAGFSLRQCHFRTHLEPQLHRSRADHCG
jgi:glucose-6-phosphate 1-dehydrogenase